MKRRINTKKVSETSDYMKKQIDLLKQYQDKLIKDIDKIPSAYFGKDANIIVSKFKDKANDLDSIIETIDSYTKYFDIISGSYNENINRAIKKIRKTPKATEITNPIENITLDLENIILEEEVEKNEI